MFKKAGVERYLKTKLTVDHQDNGKIFLKILLLIIIKLKSSMLFGTGANPNLLLSFKLNMTMYFMR